MRVLMIEDDAILGAGLSKYLNKHGIDCDIANSGESGLTLFNGGQYDAVLADLNLGGYFSGFQVLERIRNGIGSNHNKAQTPILVISGLAAISDKINSFVSGADDYLTKPFNNEELIARIYSLVRRASGYSHNLVKIGDLTIDISSKTVVLAGNQIDLTSKEYSLLEFIVLKKGSTVSKQIILSHLYGQGKQPTPKIADVLICKIRQKLAKYSNQEFLSTIWGMGYKINIDLDENAAEGIEQISMPTKKNDDISMNFNAKPTPISHIDLSKLEQEENLDDLTDEELADLINEKW